jgi:lysophospholipase L1-like esterase
LEEYKANLEKIITHPKIVAHNPRIILIAPPPVNEHLWWPRDQESGYNSVTRTAATTKVYADAVVEMGATLNLPVVNLWKAFMAKTNFQIDTWKAGDLLPGSLESAQNDALVELMYDGKWSCFQTTTTITDPKSGLHFHPAGYEIMYNELTKLIAERWPDQVAEKLPMVLPAWNDAAAWETWGASH